MLTDLPAGVFPFRGSYLSNPPIPYPNIMWHTPRDYGGDHLGNYVLVETKNRDSENEYIANFAYTYNLLKNYPGFKYVRIKHWLVGHVDYILMSLSDFEGLEAARIIMEDKEQSYLLDDDLYFLARDYYSYLSDELPCPECGVHGEEGNGPAKWNKYTCECGYKMSKKAFDESFKQLGESLSTAHEDLYPEEYWGG